MNHTNYALFLALLGNCSNETDVIETVTADLRAAVVAVAELFLRNPERVEGAEFSFSRRDRGVAVGLATKFLNGVELFVDDAETAVALAKRYRKQIAKLLPVAPTVELVGEVELCLD